MNDNPHLQKITYNELINLVTKKRFAFSDRYRSDPKYIKMPLWLSEELQKSGFTSAFEFGVIHGTFCGLIICPTISIVEIDKIEVF